MSMSDDLRTIRDLAENISTDLGEIAFRLDGVIERETDRRAVLAEMTRDETADGVRADGFPGATSSALGDALRDIPVDRTRVTRWVLLDDGTRRDLAARADVLTAERDEARAEAEAAHEGRINALNRVTAVERERDDLRAEVRHLHAVIAGDESVRGASWKRLRRDRAAAVAAVGRVRALLDGRSLVPVGLLAEALEGVQEARGSILTAPQVENGHGGVDGSSGATGGVERVSDPGADLDAACAWSDYRREYGVSADDRIRHSEECAFLAGWQAARGTLDLGGVSSPVTRLVSATAQSSGVDEPLDGGECEREPCARFAQESNDLGGIHTSKTNSDLGSESSGPGSHQQHDAPGGRAGMEGK